MHSNRFKDSICLNGWWDFIPVFQVDSEPVVPEDGWVQGKYLVPSVWTKPFDGVRKKGETYFGSCSDVFNGGDWEFLFDAYGYPLEWSKTRCGWVRRTIDVGLLEPTTRLFLLFEGVMPRARLFINGSCVGSHIHPTLPFELDITEHVHEGENDVALLIEDYECDESGRAKVPTGSWIPTFNSGIWQDVYLVKRNEVFVCDTTVRTYTRNKTISVAFEVNNASDRERTFALSSEIVDWAKGADLGAAESVLDIPSRQLTVSSGTSASIEITVDWPHAKWWYPENPKLYVLRTTISENGIALDVNFERFGFREVWIDGSKIMLNDYPLHLFSDWGHKTTPFAQTEGWIRKWFGMIRDANMNHSRLHTHPHPCIYLDLADEEGILITGETGIHGSGGSQAGDSPDYWNTACEHIRRFIRRDKNHPSVILWSIENEMRHNLDKTTLPVRKLPELKKLFNELDPTRPAYHEGDSSLWNEKTQDIVSRHYGKECAGVGWWDEDKPLHSGEMGLYHYAGPNNTIHLAGDAAFSSFKAIDEAAALDVALIIEAGRTLGVSCFGPWNLSCLENLRMDTERVELHYDDFSFPGAKPLFVEPHSSEFNFWMDGKGYTPNHSFAIQAQAFRPFAVIDRSLRKSYFSGGSICREIFIVNDTDHYIRGALSICLSCDGTVIHQEFRDEITLSRGEVKSASFEMVLPEDVARLCTYTVHFTDSNGDVLDCWDRVLKIDRVQSASSIPSDLIAVIGTGDLANALDALGIGYIYVDSIDEEMLSGFPILIMETGTVCQGSRQNIELMEFVRRGGRLVLMEQCHSVFPGVALVDKPVLKAFVRSYGHELLDGICEDDFAGWGEDPYPLMGGDSLVAQMMYVKDDGTHILSVLDSGEGGFGTGDLSYTPLFESYIGDGLVIACQLRLKDKMNDVPPAAKLFANLIRRATTFVPEKKCGPIIADGAQVHNINELVDKAVAGEIILVNGVTTDSLEKWAEILGVNLKTRDVGEVYQAVRVLSSPLLAGISNEDTCGIETWVYAATGSENFVIGDTFITPADGIEPLLETPTESCLRELMVYGGKTEPLRAHTLSRFLYVEKPERAVALGIVRTGKGMIIFNQIKENLDNRAKFNRYMNRLLGNLGVVFEGSIFDGNCVPLPETNSFGYATKVFVCSAANGLKIFDELVESTRLQVDFMEGSRTLCLCEWKEVVSENGSWHSAEFGEPNGVLIYHRVFSPTFRKDLQDIGVANPAALTHIDITGEGTISITINGYAFEQMSLVEEGLATINNIELEKGWNNVLVGWHPKSNESMLKMQWRNIDGRPEIGLKYE